MLLQAGIIDEFQLNSALSHQRNLGGRLGASLVKLGYLSEERLQEVLAEQLKLARIDLARQDIAAAVLAYIPEAKAREFNVIPVDRRQIHGTMHLLVAMSDPTNLIVTDALQFLTGCRVRPALATEAAIRTAIDRWYRPKPAGEQEAAHGSLVVEETPGESEMTVAAAGPMPETVAAPGPRPRAMTAAVTAEEKLQALLALLQEKGILSAEECLRFG